RLARPQRLAAHRQLGADGREGRLPRSQARQPVRPRQGRLGRVRAGRPLRRAGRGRRRVPAVRLARGLRLGGHRLDPRPQLVPDRQPQAGGQLRARQLRRRRRRRRPRGREDLLHARPVLLLTFPHSRAHAMNTNIRKVLLTTLLLGLAATGGAAAQNVELLNVSYDPTRELYAEFNDAFARKWKAETGETLTVRASHGGSGKQARSVIDGLEADVVTLALSGDIDAIAQNTDLLARDWQKRLPNNSSPYTSTIVFLVRKGNPKNIRACGHLARPGIGVITPNPKTSGGARWNYLAAWAWASREYRKVPLVLDYLKKLFGNVPVLDTGARGSTTTFVERGIGDVLLAWENEALLTLADGDTAARFEIVFPSLSIKAEPPVAVVDGNVDRRGTRALAEAYLQHLYSPEGQRLAAKHHYRPSRPDLVPAAAIAHFKPIPLVTIDDAFGGWAKAQQLHFSDGGFFDRIYRP